eukprot:533853-Pleurochrysis_carterae.AAC.1
MLVVPSTHFSASQNLAANPLQADLSRAFRQAARGVRGGTLPVRPQDGAAQPRLRRREPQASQGGHLLVRRRCTSRHRRRIL